MPEIITNEEIKTRQIELLNYFKATCEELGLRYSLAYGTLLGAVRHGGYIPWDDDIDVCLPREDYNKLVEAMKTRDGRIQLYEGSKRKKFYISYAKLVDTDTYLVLDDKKAIQMEGDGINIDVFPFDNCPDSEKEFKKYYFKLTLLRQMKSITSQRGIPWRNSKLKTLINSFLKLFAVIFGYRFWTDRITNLSQKYNKKETENICVMSVTFSYNERIPRSQFENMSKIAFEGEEYMCFSDVDAYLSGRYGDYMQLPPEEQRVAPHGFTAYRK